MRALVLSVLVMAGCSDIVCGLGTTQDGSKCVPSNGVGEVYDTANPEDGPHPLVPAEFQYLWNTGPCEKENGKTGSQVYILVENGRAEADGSFTGTERWFWFWEESGWEDDCVDSIEITMSPMTQDMGAMGCSVCDEGFEGRRKVLENNCGVSYENRFVNAKRPDEQVSYPVILMLDTLTPSDTPNVDQKMLVYGLNADNDGQFSGQDVNKDYGEGHIFPDDVEGHYGYPAGYDWVGSRCY